MHDKHTRKRDFWGVQLWLDDKHWIRTFWETKLWSRHQRAHTSSWNIKSEFGFPSWSVTIRVCISPRNSDGHPDEELSQFRPCLLPIIPKNENYTGWYTIFFFFHGTLKSGAPWRKQGKSISPVFLRGQQSLCCWAITRQESKSFRIRVRSNNTDL